MGRVWVTVTLLFIVLLVFSMPAAATPVGGLSYNIARDYFTFSVSGGVSFGQRDVHLDDNDDVQDELNSSRFIAKIDIAPVKYVDFYMITGAADLQLDDGDFKGFLSPMLGAGLRPNLFPLVWESNLFVSADLQYLTYNTADGDTSAKLQEFQAGIIVSYVLRGLAPYGGLKYDEAYVQFEGNENDMSGDIDFAVFVGCDYFVTPNVFFNVDLNIFSETRIYAGVGYKY